METRWRWGMQSADTGKKDTNFSVGLWQVFAHSSVGIHQIGFAMVVDKIGMLECLHLGESILMNLHAVNQSGLERSCPVAFAQAM